jgi:hypothetical protein
MMAMDGVLNIGDNIKLSIEDAQRMIHWFEVPEGKIFYEHLQQQINIVEDRADAPIGINPVADLLNRERNISASLTMKSILKWPLDIAEMIKEYEEQNKTLDK